MTSTASCRSQILALSLAAALLAGCSGGAAKSAIPVSGVPAVPTGGQTAQMTLTVTRGTTTQAGTRNPMSIPATAGSVDVRVWTGSGTSGTPVATSCVAFAAGATSATLTVSVPQGTETIQIGSWSGPCSSASGGQGTTGTGTLLTTFIGTGAVLVTSTSISAVFNNGNPIALSTPVTPALVTTLADSGAGSLRAAITALNMLPTGSTGSITFGVSGSIVLASALPAIAVPMKIDGTTAPGYLRQAPVVEINANGQAGLVFGTGATGSQLLGLAVNGASGNGVTINAASMTLAGNYIGLTLSGTARANTGDGVYVAATSSNDTIGINATNASGAISNVISGNGGNGISLNGSNNDVIVANRIGTNSTGKTAVPNALNGIYVTAASMLNTIGGTVFTDSVSGQTNNPTGSQTGKNEVFIVPPLGNQISGNLQNGVQIDGGSAQNLLEGNFIGTDATGNVSLGNGGDGVYINAANYNGLIGCTLLNNPFVYYNVIGGNGTNGVEVTNSTNTTIQGNFIGLGANNATAVPNLNDGILVDGNSQKTWAGGPIPLGNGVSGNKNNGIELKDTSTGFISYNNFTGISAFGGAVPNGNDGYLITANPPGALGQTTQTIQTCISSGNAKNGIEITGNAWGVFIDPVEVGTNSDGYTAIPNGGDGILIGGNANNNLIGGVVESIMTNTLVSGNSRFGIEISGTAYSNQVVNSIIGATLVGLGAVPNVMGGVLISAATTAAYPNIIGGPSSALPSSQGNQISGNSGPGVTLAPGSAYARVINNNIGYQILYAANPATSNPSLPLPNTIPIVNGGTNNTIAGNTCFPSAFTPCP